MSSDEAVGQRVSESVVNCSALLLSSRVFPGSDRLCRRLWQLVKWQRSGQEGVSFVATQGSKKAVSEKCQRIIPKDYTGASQILGKGGRMKGDREKCK